MNSTKLETYALAALFCAWMVFGSRMLGNLFVNVDLDMAAAAHGGGAEAKAPAPAAAEAKAVADLGTLLAAADPGEGEKAFGKCKACHGVEAGGAHKVGPNLHDIIGADIAGKDGFAYSGALAGHDGTWTYEALYAFLADPKGWAPGTKMTFAGLAKSADRANVIAYLRENTGNPPPLPEPQAETGADGSSGAGGGEAPATAPSNHQ